MASSKLIVAIVGIALALGLFVFAWTPGSGSLVAQSDSMHSCPLPGTWAISVWSGNDGTAAEQALATCGAGAVDAAYSLDPETGGWSRWFAGRPEVSNLPPLNDMQGLLVLGAATGAGVTPTPTATTTPAPGAVSAKEAYPPALQVARASQPDAYLDDLHAGCSSSRPICLEWDWTAMEPGDGRSGQWEFEFYSPAAHVLLDVYVVHGQAQASNAPPMDWDLEPPNPLPLEEMIDSTEAVRIADTAGGNAYKTATPGGQLCGAEVGDWGRGLEWHIDYCPPFEQGGAGFTAWIDGRTGEVTKTREPQWPKPQPFP